MSRTLIALATAIFSAIALTSSPQANAMPQNEDSADWPDLSKGLECTSMWATTGNIRTKTVYKTEGNFMYLSGEIWWATGEYRGSIEYEYPIQSANYSEKEVKKFEMVSRIKGQDSITVSTFKFTADSMTEHLYIELYSGETRVNRLMEPITCEQL